MSGHSKWSSIKHKKAATDARRGQLFTKLAREITVSARDGGDPDVNSTLRLAIQRAKDNNMPNDNIERAVQRGAGGGDSNALREVTYEGYGPGGAAVLVVTLTDNRNRTVAEVRSTFSRGGGSMAETGAVAWQFELRGVIVVDSEHGDYDDVQLTAIEAGALDVSVEDGEVEVITEPNLLESVRDELTAAGLRVARSEILQLPQNIVDLDHKSEIQTLKLLESLDELDDVARVYSNADFSGETIEALGVS